jgi:hypothetical protein
LNYSFVAYLSTEILTQLTIGNSVRFAEVCFYFRIHRRNVALVSLFSMPDEHLRTSSYDTLWVCKYSGDNNLIVVDAKSICSVVSMPPFPPPANPDDSDSNLYFVDEDLGFDVADLDPFNVDVADGADA